MEFAPFVEWKSKIERLEHVETTEIIVTDVDLFGDKIGFLKAKAKSKLKATILPGIVFLRGGSVSILCVLTPLQENQEPRVILTEQPRLAVGSSSLLELPAGMIDSCSNFTGIAAKELQEECGIRITEDQLIDLTGLAYESEPWVYPSPGIMVALIKGGCDEFVKLYLYRERLALEDIEALENRLGGLVDHGERILLRIVPLSQVWMRTRDVKALSSLYLMHQLQSQGKIHD